jgi:hypothetical protein
MKRKINWKREIRDWSIIIGMSSLGTFMAFITWITKPEVQEVIRKTLRL